jgi:3-oxoacyl-[acyl-carrier-protein] synthase II
MGVVSCCGIGLDAFWDGLQNPAPEGERRVQGFDASAWFGPKEVRRVDRFAQFSVAAADMARSDAGEIGADPDRAGVVFATGVGGLETLQEQIGVFHEKGPRRVSPFLIPMMMVNAGAAHVAMQAGWHGPCETIATACAAGTHAIAAASRLVATGRCDVTIGGGAEAAMVGIGMAAFGNMTALSSEGKSRPFDARRDGFVCAEGGAALVLEDLDHARRRGARIYAEVLGSGSTADAHHITAPAPGGNGAAACMELALADAGVSPSDIGHINAHGTSTPLNDLAEAQAIEKVFGSPSPPVTSIKGVTGHALGGAGAIEAVATTLTIDRRLIPPTAGYGQPDPEIHLDVVHGQARPWDPAPALSNSFGFGGHNGCLVIGPPPA